MLNNFNSLRFITAIVLLVSGIFLIANCWGYSEAEKHFNVKYDQVAGKDNQIDIHVTITNKSGETVVLTNVLKSCVCIDSKFEQTTIADGACTSFSYRVDTRKLASNSQDVGVTVLMKYPDNVVSSLFVPVPTQVISKFRKG